MEQYQDSSLHLERLPDEILFDIILLLGSPQEVLQCRQVSTFFQSMVDYAPDFFWRTLYLRRWSSGAPFASNSNTTIHDDEAISSTTKDEKSNLHADKNSGISTDSVDWKYYCRQHAYNRIDWDSFPRDSKPVLALKPSLTGAIYRSHATSSEYGHVPIRSVRSEEQMRPLFQAGRLGYFEVHIRETGGEQVITVGVCSKSFPLRSKAVGWSSGSANSSVSAGFHCDDGRKFTPSDPAWVGCPNWNTRIGSKPTVVGCGINFETKEVFFTRDGVFLGIAYDYRTKPIPPRARDDFDSSGWYSVIAMMADPADIDINFGQNLFVFDLTSSIMWQAFGNGVTPKLAYLANPEAMNTPVPYTSEMAPQPQSSDYELSYDDSEDSDNVQGDDEDDLDSVYESLNDVSDEFGAPDQEEDMDMDP